MKCECRGSCERHGGQPCTGDPKLRIHWKDKRRETFCVECGTFFLNYHCNTEWRQDTAKQFTQAEY